MKFRKSVCRCGYTIQVPTGESLKRIREKIGASLRSVAKAIPIDPGYLSKIENNKKLCPVRVMDFYETLEARSE